MTGSVVETPKKSASSYSPGEPQMVKNLPAMQETGVQSLGLENPLEKGMANHSSILAWRIPWKVEPLPLTRLSCLDR